MLHFEVAWYLDDHTAGHWDPQWLWYCNFPFIADSMASYQNNGATLLLLERSQRLKPQTLALWALQNAKIYDKRIFWSVAHVHQRVQCAYFMYDKSGIHSLVHTDTSYMQKQWVLGGLHSHTHCCHGTAPMKLMQRGLHASRSFLSTNVDAPQMT